MEGDSLYYGLNAVSNNMIMADRKQLKNPNGLILGTPGSGKSFSAKREITNVFFTTTDDIIVADPEGEYYPLVEALGGQVIHISSTSKDYINPMDINLNYADDDNPLGMKSDFILSLCELIMGARDGMEPEEKSVIDRCLPLVYQKYLNDPKPENERFNIQRPADFTGHSLSVSDVVVLNDGSTVKAYYVDSIGFAELPDFFKERNMDLQKENLLNEKLQEIEIFDKPGLFSNGRLRDEDVPEGLYRYDLRGSDYDPGQPITVEKTVVVNHAASVLMAEELDLGAEGRLELGEEGLNFTGAELTVREFMEEQQQKNNALIHGDSDHIAVEGHIGTWYAIDETEIAGEKFFLLEHEEHGDMAACVAVNEQGKLVAEDLWNGFDDEFLDAVKEYLSEKWNMPNKDDVVSEIIEKAVPAPDNSAQDYSDVPVYYEPFSYAKENDEVDLYRTSYRLNSECKQAIHEAIADNYDGMYLGDGAVDQVVRQYGMERVGYILANTLHHKSYDGRFSHSNKEWAEQVGTPENNARIIKFRADWVVTSHSAVLDGFVTMYREKLEKQKELEQPFVKRFYVVENLQAAPLKIERFGNLDDAMSQYQALPNNYMKALGVEKNPDHLPGSLDVLQCRNGIDTIVEDYKTVPGWDNPYRVFQIKEVHHQHWAKSYAQQVEDGFLIHHQNYQSAYKGKPAPSDTPMTARKRLEEKRPNTFIGRSVGVGDVIVWDEEKERKFFYVNKEELIEFGGFMDADAAGNTVVYMVPNYQIDGKTGTWLPYDSEVVEGVCFFMMRNEQRKDTVSPIVVDSKGVFVTDAPNGFENVRAVLAEYVHRAEKKQQDMTEHEKCLMNGTYERARESGTEQNYDMIDGCVNNVSKKPRRIGGRWSVLDRLHIKQAERKQKEQPQQQQQERSRKN